jgi:hypothetical protein
MPIVDITVTEQDHDSGDGTFAGHPVVQAARRVIPSVLGLSNNGFLVVGERRPGHFHQIIPVPNHAHIHPTRFSVYVRD